MPGMLDSLFEIASLPALAMVAAAVFVAGFLRGFLGFGGALIIIMVLNVVLGPRFAVAVACLAGLPSTFQLLPTAVRDSDRGFVLPFGIASFVAAPLGTLVLVSLAPALMKVVVSALVLAMVALLYRGWLPAKALSRGALVGAGTAAGLVQGTAGVGGPPAVAAALSRPGETGQQRANVIGAVTALSLSAVLPLWYHGLFTREVMLASLAIVPIYVASTWIGARYFSSQGHRHYRDAALLTLAVSGVATLLIALRDYAST